MVSPSIKLGKSAVLPSPVLPLAMPSEGGDEGENESEEDETDGWWRCLAVAVEPRTLRAPLDLGWRRSGSLIVLIAGC